MTTTTSTSAATATNKPTFAETLAQIKDLGEQAGKGQDVQIKMFLKVTEASFLGVIDLDPDKHGKGIDDATKLSDEYSKAQSGTSIFSTKAAKKTISCNKLGIRLGMFTKGGPGEPLSTLNTLMTTWRKERSKPENKGQMVDAFNCATRFAREQLKRPTMIGESELRSMCFKPTKDAQTDEDFLAALRKQVLKRSSKDAATDTAIDGFKAIAQACTKTLTAIAKAKAPQSGMATPSKVSVATPTTTAA